MSDNPVKTFKFSDSFPKQGFLFLAVGVILIFVSFAIPPLSAAAGMAIVLGIINIVLYTNKDVIKIFDKHLEIKTAPIASLKIIKFDDIKSVSKENKVIVIKLNSDTKPVKIHTRVFNKNEISRVVSSLAKLNPAAAAA